ncbi:uncharacterized protein METZ01_LOCUS327953, partial [marine metagenome]
MDPSRDLLKIYDSGSRTRQGEFIQSRKLGWPTSSRLTRDPQPVIVLLPSDRTSEAQEISCISFRTYQNR